MDWVKNDLHTQSNNLGLFYIERLGNKEKYQHHPNSNSIIVHNQRVIHQVLSMLNKDNSRSTTYNFIINHLSKMMTNIKWKKTRIGVTTLGLLMLANLIKKGIREKLMKSVSIQNGCNDDSLYDHVLPKRIQNRIPTDDTNKRKHQDLLRILSATLNKEKYFVENLVYIFLHEEQLK